MATVSVRGLVKEFDGEVRAVDGVSFDVADGELITLLGPSGCGKTTTLRLSPDWRRPTKVRSTLATAPSPRPAVGSSCHPRSAAREWFSRSSTAIWPHMTVFSNVAYPLRMRRMGGKDIRAKVEETLALVGLLELRNRMATHLSGGQQQRTAIARAIVREPVCCCSTNRSRTSTPGCGPRCGRRFRELQRTLGSRRCT